MSSSGQLEEVKWLSFEGWVEVSAVLEVGPKEVRQIVDIEAVRTRGLALTLSLKRLEKGIVAVIGLMLSGEEVMSLRLEMVEEQCGRYEAWRAIRLTPSRQL